MGRDASHALRECGARALRAHKTLTPRVNDFFTDFEKKKKNPTVLRSIFKRDVAFLFFFVKFRFLTRAESKFSFVFFSFPGYG